MFQNVVNCANDGILLVQSGTSSVSLTGRTMAGCMDWRLKELNCRRLGHNMEADLWKQAADEADRAVQKCKRAFVRNAFATDILLGLDADHVLSSDARLTFESAQIMAEINE